MSGSRDEAELTDASGMRFAIVAARFNEEIVSGLIDGARACLLQCGVDDDNLTLTQVPGAFELPVAAQQVAITSRPDALIALGAVIRGDTAHFEYISGECASGLARVSLDHRVPVSFGVLTCDTLKQAQLRCAPGKHNKGAEAALAAVEMAALFRALDNSG